MSSIKSNSALIYGLIVLVALARVVPHPWNVAPIGALGLFSGAYIPARWAWALPLIALLLGDVLLGLSHPVVMLFVYLGFAGSAVCGRVFLRRRRSASRFGGAIGSAALLFYLLSNFGMWIVYYPHSWAGLIACYVNALPFLLKSLMGDVLYCALLFGSYEAAVRFGVGARVAKQSADS